MGEWEDWKAAEAFWYFDAVRKSALETSRLVDAIDALSNSIPGGIDPTAPQVKASRKGDSLEQSVIRVMELMDRYRTELQQYTELQESAKAAIDMLEDERYRAVLMLHYVNGRTWAEVADSTHYNERYCMALRDEAMCEVWEHIPKQWKTMIPRAD